MRRTASLMCGFLLVAASAFCSVTGSIGGTVTDNTGSVIPGATVRALNVETKVATAVKTNKDGVYSFPDLAVGRYDIQIQAAGFSEYQEKGIVLDVNTAFRVDATLQVGAVTQHIEVSANAVQVDTDTTQLGEVIGEKSITDLPLNGRSYTDLLALQPGVVPSSVETINTYTPSAPSGGLSDGTLSISGARGNSNGFMVNGGNVQEQMANGTAIIPNVDSIAEFRIITNNFDAEYGHYSGGVVNVITKSGTDKFHGNVFDFLRNTDLDARNYYAPARGVYRQNQFGGTFGGPIVREKLFFFADYQGTRQTIGAATGLVAVPSAADRSGNLSDESIQLTGTVVGPAFASSLTQGLGYPVSVGEPFYTSGCTSSASCVFPNAVIPQSVWSAPALQLLQTPYIPAATIAPSASFPTGAYSSAAVNAPMQDDKAGFHLDANTRLGLFSNYYFIDKYSLTNPFAGGTFGNFGGATSGTAQLFTIRDTKTVGSTMVNEFLMSYTRNASFGGMPTGPAVDLGALGFTVGCNTLGICAQSSSYKTLPPISFNNFTVGGPAGSEGLWENTYQAQNNYSWSVGTHSLKFGGIFALSQVNMQTYYANNGMFGFTGSAETGLDFADFLLGAAATWNQGVQLPLYTRSMYYGMFAQDSWRARHNLTLNYGVRWDVTTPWWEKFNRMEALVPGRQSVVFPSAPEGWDVPGDPGIPKTIAPIQYANFSPRIGVAYSPDPQGGIWQRLVGSHGQSSIRASFGMFYSDLEDFTNANGNGDAPFGLYWANPSPAMFATPFVDLYTGNPEGQRFPLPSGAINASVSNPDASVNWAQYEPISSSPTYYYGNVTPYTESWMMSIQRQIVNAAVVTVSYIGNVGKHQMVVDEANPSTPSVCLSVSQPSEVAAGSNVCGPYAETGLFTTISGQAIEARQELGPSGGVDFGSTGWFRTMGSSAYHALEASLHYTRGPASILAAYTYGKAMDDSSSATEQVMPFKPGSEWALSAFNVKQNFVVSYSYELPFAQLFRHSGQQTKGWNLSGSTRFSTGFPITMMENDDLSLIGNTSVGPTGDADEPNYTPGKLLLQTNPRHGGSYFNTSLFSYESLGQFGNARRRFFSGPGLNNTDMALEKDIHFTESLALELRGEFFNIFNHAQFVTPSGLINSASFGVVTSANDPRIGQIAAKMRF